MAEQSPSTRTLSRSRGAVSGILLVLLGAWGAIAPFVGPYFNFTYSPDITWHWTAARGWFQVLPGAVTFLGGLLLLFGRGRGVTMLGAWLAILGGAWFVIGPPLSSELTLGQLGGPIGTSSGQRAAETLGLFTGLGAVILFLAAAAFGRLSVVTVRDMRRAERREAERAEAEERANREQAERDRDWQAGGPAQSPYDQHADNPGAYGQPAQTQQLPPQQQAQPQSPPQPPDESQQGYHSALGYREGEQPAQYDPPTYGRHDANVRAPGSESNGDAADTAAEQTERR